VKQRGCLSTLRSAGVFCPTRRALRAATLRPRNGTEPVKVLGALSIERNDEDTSLLRALRLAKHRARRVATGIRAAPSSPDRAGIKGWPDRVAACFRPSRLALSGGRAPAGPIAPDRPGTRRARGVLPDAAVTRASTAGEGKAVRDLNAHRDRSACRPRRGMHAVVAGNAGRMRAHLRFGCRGGIELCR
jgi:hypothetical protein